MDKGTCLFLFLCVALRLMLIVSCHCSCVIQMRRQSNSESDMLIAFFHSHEKKLESQVTLKAENGVHDLMKCSKVRR